ncbi:hypothetical protein MLD38_039720 [Melastoma candidum]|uniref:Uncharacterized protein n=1 Tax=Melastoma candidum TaxID=119954 RepID=A0ACB9L3Q3_9MYRT|nr:hypothetical protein MLD38_039720 [Melastoma candidum]
MMCWSVPLKRAGGQNPPSVSVSPGSDKPKLSAGEIVGWICLGFKPIEQMPGSRKHLESSRIAGVFEKLLKDTGNPVDFKVPKWCNYDKDKPLPYTFIRRNVYLTKRIKKRMEDDGIFCACCPSPGSSGVCSKDCHCGMLLSTCFSGCKCGDSCVNKPFQSRHIKKMKLVETEKCGSGIVADEDIQRGEFIIEYVGEVIDDKTCEERLWKMKHLGETNFYLCEINRDMVIDATYKGNKSRYINHSCSPNTEMQKWIIDGETRIGIFATHDIKKGEHLTYDYQFVQFGADQECHCGAICCRKKLGVNPNKPKESADCQVYQRGGLLAGRGQGINHRTNCVGEVVKLAQPVNERVFGIVRRFDNFSRKHAVMFEDGSICFLDMSKEPWEFVNR